MGYLAISLAIAIPAFGVALGQGMVVRQAIDAVWRQPESVGEVRSLMILGLAFLEALAIYGLLIAFILNGKV